ncbi:MAG: type II toxin-antitoxin system Phd/YefM family antitoxin [Burkholderiaceae bacterium]|nr:type II toxin-antitoxin system Phd/YefM family antitoxin [Aquabacterium sp.]NUP85447.1 type II toxin-antitoxin system Phd/YefM family antitoxin [Burkholderiaceae bacterium]
MITETSAVAFRQNLGEMLNIVQYRNDSVLIKKDGKPVAALIDARLFERIRRMQERFDALCDRLELTYAGVPETQALAEIERATACARTETANAWRVAGRLPALPDQRMKRAAKPAMPATKAAPAKRRAAAAKTKAAR